MYFENKREFINKLVKHNRRIQDNLILLELNKDKLPFELKEFELVRISFVHDIDKMNEENIDDRLKIIEFWRDYRNKTNKEGLITKEELKNISKKHYEVSKHHVEYYEKNKEPIELITLCEMACDMFSICEEYNVKPYKEHLIENRGSKFKILNDFQIKSLLYLLDLLKFLKTENRLNSFFDNKSK